MSEEPNYNFEEATIEMLTELAKEVPKFSLSKGEWEELPEDPESGLIILFSPIKNHIIYIKDKWYVLPKAEPKKLDEEYCEEDPRNEVIENLFKINEHENLPKELYSLLASIIDTLEANREVIFRLERSSNLNEVLSISVKAIKDISTALKDVESAKSYVVMYKDYWMHLDKAGEGLKEDQETIQRIVDIFKELSEEKEEEVSNGDQD